MRIRFEFELPDGRLQMPVHYNHLVQAMIYKNISPQLADFLHSKGFFYEKRQFKLFTFSKLMGKYRIQKDNSHHSRIVFYSPIHFFLSAPFGQILQEFANQMVRGTTITLGGNLLNLCSVQVLLPPVFKHKITRIKMLSPISVHSTVAKEDGSKKTYFYLPTEKEFSELVRKNLLKKYVSFLETYPEDTELSLRPLFFSEKKNFHLVIYKDHVVKGYSGIYELVGSRELKQFAYDSGLGERNAQGFGMFDIWQKNEK